MDRLMPIILIRIKECPCRSLPKSSSGFRDCLQSRKASAIRKTLCRFPRRLPIVSWTVMPSPPSSVLSRVPNRMRKDSRSWIRSRKTQLLQFGSTIGVFWLRFSRASACLCRFLTGANLRTTMLSPCGGFWSNSGGCAEKELLRRL